jgi:hypothetical protein
MRQNSLRVLEDYELDHVSGGLDDGADFYADPFVIPDGYSLENISGATLVQNMVTGEWTVELVFESDFTEAGYASSGDTPEDGGGGFQPIMPIGQSPLDVGPELLMAGGGGQQTTRTTRVTTTRTSASAKFSINFFGFKFEFAGPSTTVVSEETTTATAGRVTSQGKQGRLPSQ